MKERILKREKSESAVDFPHDAAGLLFLVEPGVVQRDQKDIS